jgi:hypothetical protein
MPKGPQGQKRPADVIGNAVHVMRIATGEATETLKPKDTAAVERGKAGGLKGGKARASAMTKLEVASTMYTVHNISYTKF